MICFARRVQPVVGYPDYFISAIGEVYSKKTTRTRRMKQSVANTGYNCVNLTPEGGGRNNQRVENVHQLIADAFCRDRLDDEIETRHRDGNKLNNHVCNLEPCTVLINSRDKKVHDPTFLQGIRHSQVKLTEKEVYEIRKLYDDCELQLKDIGNMYGVHHNTISSIGRRVNWKHLPEKID